MLSFTPVKYNPGKPPFDGKPVLLKTKTGIVEAYYRKTTYTDCWGEEATDEYFLLCYDKVTQIKPDEVLGWCCLRNIERRIAKTTLKNLSKTLNHESFTDLKIIRADDL